MKPINLLLLGISIFLPSSAIAADAIPDCIAYGRPLPVNNAQVLHWKRTTPNQFRERAHIQGTLQTLYADHSGHHHWQVQIGSQTQDTIEVIYNEDFGAIPTPQVGMNIEACGDFITATAQSGPNPPSPDGAIVHWVHMNPSSSGHLPGYLVVDGTLCGQDPSQAGPKPPHGYTSQ
jgi:hypothetical protein